jgi:hypothetical protein
MCLERLINIDDPCKPATANGLKISDLPGFTWEGLGVQASSKYLTGIAFLERTRTDVVGFISDTIKSNIISGGRFELLIRQSPPLNTSASYSGNFLSSGGSHPQRGTQVQQLNRGCAMNVLQLKTIEIRPLAVGTLILSVSNGVKVINKTITINAAGVNTVISIDYGDAFYSHDGVFSAWTDGGVPLTDTGIQCGCGAWPIQNGNDCYKSVGYERGSGMTTNALSYGLRLKVSCTCDWSSFVCGLATMNNSLFNRLVLRSMEYALRSDAHYGSTLLSINSNATERLAVLSQEINDSYASILPLAESMLKSAQYSTCVTCKGLTIGLMN